MESLIVQIIGNTVNSFAINDCIEKFKIIKEDQKSILKIIAHEEIIVFDFSLIGHFILFKHAKSELEIEIHLEKNFSDDIELSREKSIVWKLRQYMVHAYYSTGKNIFNLIDGNGEISRAESDKKKGSRFELSKKYLPVIYLNSNNYYDIFHNKLNFVPIATINLKGKNDEDGLYQACRRLLFSKVTPNNYVQILSQLAFYGSLKEAKMLRYFLFEELSLANKKILDKRNNKENFYVSKVKDYENKKLYRSGLIPLFEELKNQPPIHLLIFFTFISSDLVFPKLHTVDSKDIMDQKEIIKSLWEFTKELAYGINELAKNIVTHTPNKEGIIDGFVNDKFDFELSVFDHGEDGIMKTFLNSFTKKKKEFNKKGFLTQLSPVQEDINMITEKVFTFKSFFDTNTKNILNEQSSRATAHLGILFFSKLIEENKGSLEVISNNQYGEIHLYPESSTSLPNIGTYYRTTLSLIKSQKYKPYKKIDIPQPEYKSNLDGIDFFNFKLARNEAEIDHRSISILRLTIADNLFEDRISEERLWNHVRDLIKINYPHLDKSLRTKIIYLDFHSLTDDINSSQFFRFLGKWELNYPDIQLIIINVKTKLVFELKNINEFYYSKTNIDYWNENKSTLIYSYEELSMNGKDIDSNKRFYFIDILWGKKEEDFLYINDRISNNYYNATTKHRDFDRTSYNYHDLEQKWHQKLPFPLFDKTDTLLPLDLLIEDSNFNKPLFHFNTETLLQNRLREERSIAINELSEESLKDYIQNLQKHKISKTHFRLGSKIHISDFYYAKPFFQNSFYAQKYAFLLAYEIIHHHFSKESNIKELSLIGYGLYSELLVSSVKELIENYVKNVKVSCNTVNDSEEVKLNRPSVSLLKNVIIIVPIATTFSTSMKIENMLREHVKRLHFEGKIEFEHINVLYPNLNVLLVVDESFQNIYGEVPYGILRQYGWKYIDKRKKTVTIISYVETKGKTNFVEQRYFIPLLTRWNDIKDCNNCFPDIHKNDTCTNNRNCNICEKKCALKEISLFDTDKTSLTPELIFGFPKARKFTNRHKIILNNNSVRYGHFIRNQNHYHYYFNDYIFWGDNKDNVKLWLEEEVRAEIVTNVLSTQSEHIVILAPGHFSNAEFVSLVNETVFGNRATIIHYDTAIENTHNFNLFYGYEIENANKLFFVDDVITSGYTFLAANSFLKRIRKEQVDFKHKLNKDESIQEQMPKGFDACIVFQNRSGHYEYEDIKRKLGFENKGSKIYAFADLHIPYIKSFNNRCPLCDELEKNKELYNNSNLTNVKIHFLRQQNKLLVEQIDLKKVNIQNSEIKNTDEKRRVEAVHRIHEWLSDADENDSKLRFFSTSTFENSHKDDWVNILLTNTESPFFDTYLKLNESAEDGCLMNETSITILKILTQPPFYNYKKIREKVFLWVNNLLDKKVQSIYNNIEKYDIFNKNSFKELKFLIRRASILNSNYLISYKLLGLLCAFYKRIEDEATSEISKNMLLYNSSKEEELFKSRFKVEIVKYETLIKEIRQFSTFFVSQVNELLYKNDSRSLELERRLLYFEKKSNVTLYKQLIRMLREENGSIIRSFSNFLEESNILNQLSGRKLFCKIQDMMMILSKQEHYRFKLLIDFNGTEITKIKALQSFLKLRFELRRELKRVEERTKTNLDKIDQNPQYFTKTLSQIIGYATGVKNIGSFLMVKFKKSEDNPYYLLHNEGQEKDIIKERFDVFTNLYLSNFLETGQNSIGQENISIIEFFRKDDNTWIDLFAEETEMTSKLLKGAPIIQHSNRLLLVRIDDDSIDKENKIIHYGQAVIGFYYTIDSFEHTDINITRYILLLRQDISKYLHTYCENDKFRDWVDKEKQLADALTSDHDYNSILNKLNDYRTDERKFQFLFSLVSAKEDLKSVIDNKKVEKDLNTVLNIQEEIEILYQLIFENRNPSNLIEEIIVPKDLTILYPQFIFRALIYEYIKNANSHLYDISIDDTKTRPYFYFKAEPLEDESIIIIIKNNSIFDFNTVKPFKEILATKGYAIKKEKGLYKNSLLLKATGCQSPEIIISEPDEDGVYDFCITLKLKNYGAKSN